MTKTGLGNLTFFCLFFVFSGLQFVEGSVVIFNLIEFSC